MFYNHKSKLMLAVLLLANLQFNCTATVGKRILQTYTIALIGAGAYYVTFIDDRPDSFKAFCQRCRQKKTLISHWYEKRKYFVSIDEHGVETWTRNKPTDQEWI